METILDIDLDYQGQEFPGPSWGPGQWRILHRLYDVPGGGFRSAVLASTISPEGWSVTVDDDVAPTTARVTAPFGLKDFALRAGYIQNNNTTSYPDGYAPEPLNPPIGYTVQVYSTEVIGGRAAWYAGMWDVTSYGPKADIEQVSDDHFDGGLSNIGRWLITQGDNVLVERFGNPFSYTWELAKFNGSTITEIVQAGNEEIFEFQDELEPGELYQVKLTLTNAFNKSGQRTLLVEGQAIAVYYDRSTGMVHVLYRLNNIIRCAVYPRPRPPVLDVSHPQIALPAVFSHAPHSIFRYGSQVYAVTSAALRATSQTEGFTWPPAMANSSWLLYGMTVSPDGSIFNRLFATRSNSEIKFTQTSELTPMPTTGLEGFKRPSVMLNIGTGFILIAKLGNDVVCAGSQDGLTWTGGGVVSPDSRLVGAFKTADHSIVSVMVIPRGESPQMVRLFNTGDGWDIQNATPVTGLPTTLRTPADIDSDGVRTVLVYTDGNGHGMATSDDLGLTWTVEE